jgi:leader peptidase (prepilin peptidase) / N-methyltransferase
LLGNDLSALIRAGIGLAALYLLYFSMAMIYPSGMGFGDVKLAGVLGLFLGFLGWGPLIVGAFAAFALGGLFAIVLIALRRVDRRSGIPFGPWMLSGAWVGVFFGVALWSAYLTFTGIA